MKWAFTINQKMKAAWILAAVFVLVFAKNWYDERNVSELGHSFNAFYEDRLMAESYIYRLSDHLYQKKIMLDNCSSQENKANLALKIGEQNAAIHAIILDYEKTKLTPSEAVSFNDFKGNVQAIEKLERNYLSPANAGAVTANAEINNRYLNATGNLHELSGIQVAEGKLLNDKSKQIIASSSILTQFELAILIGIGLVIQALIFAARSVKPKKPQQHFSMN